MPQIGDLHSNYLYTIASIVEVLPLSICQWIIGGGSKGLDELEEVVSTFPKSEDVIHIFWYAIEMAIGKQFAQFEEVKTLYAKLGG